MSTYSISVQKACRTVLLHRWSSSPKVEPRKKLPLVLSALVWVQFGWQWRLRTNEDMVCINCDGSYEVTPGSGMYALGIPQFAEVKVHLENGKTFSIKAQNRTVENFMWIISCWTTSRIRQHSSSIPVLKMVVNCFFKWAISQIKQEGVKERTRRILQLMIKFAFVPFFVFLTII